MAGLVLQTGEKSWIRYIRQRIKQNKNFLCFISGPTGSGKSYSCLSIAEQLDPDFSVDRVVFRGVELMDLINSGKLKRGSVVIFEEAGVEMSSRNWQSTTNKMLNFLIQTFRHRNFILLFNSPYMDFVDASTRRLFHAEFKTLSIDFGKKVVKLNPQLIQYNGRLQRFYYKYLRLITSEGVVPVRRWSVGKPSEVLLKAYELKKSAFTDALNAEISRELRVQENNKRVRSELTELQKEVLGYREEGLKIPEIAKKMNLANSSVWQHISAIRKKGYGGLD